MDPHGGLVAPSGETPNVLWAMALIAVLAAILSRGIEPALPGIWVGIDPVITAFKISGAVVSQLFAVASTAVVIGLVLGTVQSSQPSYLRAFAVGTGVLTILAVMIASAVRLPHASRVILALATGVLALMGSLLAARFFTSRAPALVVGSVAISGVVRAITIVIAALAQSTALITIARVMATLSWLVETAGLVVALVWLLTQPRPSGGRLAPPKRPRWLLLAALLIVTSALWVVVLLGHAPDASGSPVLAARAVERLLSNPAPYTPRMLREWFEVFRWLVAFSVLAIVPRGRMMAATVALALVATGTLEVPLCAVCLMIAVLALGLHPGPDLRFDAPGAGAAR
jgi:hypothetical protein